MTDKDAYWFPHDSNARDDEKIVQLRIIHGWAGYGVYWGIVEKLREQCSGNAYAMLRDYSRIAYTMLVEKELIKSVVEDFDLFAFEGENDAFFYSPSLRNRMAIWDAKKRQRKEIAKKAANARWKGVAKAKPKQSKSIARAMPNNRTEQNNNKPPKGGERVGKKASTDEEKGGKEIDHTHPAVQAYREVARRYPNKTLYPQIAEAVGEDEEDIGFWKEVVYAWIAIGWNPQNIKGILEQFAKREIPSKGRAAPKKEEVSFDSDGIPTTSPTAAACPAPAW